MPRRGPIRIPDDHDLRDEPQTVRDDIPNEVKLPDKRIIDAGMAKFLEMARLHWPNAEGGFKTVSFDIRNDRQLRMTLALAFMAMLAESIQIGRSSEQPTPD